MGFQKRSAKDLAHGKARWAWVAAGLMTAQMCAHAAGPTVAIRFGLAAPLATTAPASVPTMSEWAMAVMAVLLAVVGACVIRRQGRKGHKMLASVLLMGAAAAASLDGGDTLIRAAHAADTDVSSFYTSIFARDTDVAGLSFWSNNVGGQGQGSSAVLESAPAPDAGGTVQFINSTSNAVIQIYSAYFNRPSDDASRNFWIDTLSTCQSGTLLQVGESCTVAVASALTAAH